MGGRGIVAILLIALPAVPCRADAPIREDAKKVGQGLKKLCKDTGKAVKEGGKEVGHAFKEGGKEVGQGVKKLETDTGKAFREGGRESGQAAKNAGRSTGSGSGTWDIPSEVFFTTGSAPQSNRPPLPYHEQHKRRTP
jgi:hypothetical protein